MEAESVLFLRVTAVAPIGLLRRLAAPAGVRGCPGAQGQFFLETLKEHHGGRSRPTHAGQHELEHGFVGNATKGTILSALAVSASSYGTEKGPFVSKISRERLTDIFFKSCICAARRRWQPHRSMKEVEFYSSF